MNRRLPISWLLAVILILAAGTARFVGLGGSPLMPDEASGALAAAETVGLGSVFWTDQQVLNPNAYQILTGGIMNLFGVGEFTARVVPAIFGLALAMLPLALGKAFSWPVRLLFVLFLGFSAVILTTSRTAGAASIAAFGICLAILAVVRLHQEDEPTFQFVLGIGVGIGLAAGGGVWMGIFGLAIGLLLGRLDLTFGSKTAERGLFDLDLILNWKTGSSALLSAVLLSSGFGAKIQGLAGLFQGPADWVLGWSGMGGWPIFATLLIVLIYEPLLLGFGGYGVIRAVRSQDPVQRGAGLWALGALLALFIYPGRQPWHLIWAVIPLALLAAIQIEAIVDRILQLQMPVSSLLLALVLITVLSFAYLQLESSAAGFGLASLDREAQLAFAVTAIAFSGLLIVLFGVGWSWPETLLAVALALMVTLGGLSINAAWRLNLTQRNPRANELWRRQVSSAHLNLLEDTLANISRWFVGRDDGLPIQIQGDISAPLAWALRPHQPFEATTPLSTPPVIIAAETTSAELPADYLGQAFAIGESWGWQGVLPPQILPWLVDRSAPVHTQRYILFVRTDVAELGDQTEFLGME